MPDGFFDDGGLEALAELRPEDEPGLVLARRVFADGRTRAYAWGRAIAREDLAAATERLIAMSGQFEQRRLARPSYQLDVLDAFVGDEQAGGRRQAREAWRALTAARRRHEELARDAVAAAARIEATARPRRAHRRARARARRRRCAPSASGCATQPSSPRARRGDGRAIAPEDGEGAASLAAAAERALAPLARLAPELEAAGGGAPRPRGAAQRGRGRPAPVRRLARGRPGADRGGRGPARPDRRAAPPLRRADARRAARAPRRRRSPSSTRSTAASTRSPPRRPSSARAEARLRGTLPRRSARRGRPRSEPFAAAVAETSRAWAWGRASSVVELREREPGPTGRDEAVFLIRPNPGLPFGPVAETASGGELSRVALALAAVAGGETLVFDEIDAGIGGVTAHRVAETLSAARRARAGDHDHPPAADRERRRPPLPRREGAGRPDPHADRAALARRAPRASSSGCSAARSSSPAIASEPRP